MKRMAELDGIRGLACLLVLIDHLFIGLLPSLPAGVHYRVQPWFMGGVDLFFVLSGFLIGGILMDHRGQPNALKVFWARRIGRIWPVYYLLFLTYAAVLLVRPHVHAPWLDGFLLGDPMPLWTYAAFVQNFAMAADGASGGARWIGSTWSVAVEEQFYLLLPILALVLSRRGLVRLALACLLAAPLLRGLLAPPGSGWCAASYFLLPCRMDTLAAGVLVAAIVRSPAALAFCQRRRTLLDLAAAALAAALFAALPLKLSELDRGHLGQVALWSDYTGRAVVFAYAILRLFLVPVASPYRRVLALPLLTFFGAISYALYMYHPAINGLVHGLLFGRDPALASPAQDVAGAAVVALSTLAAWASTRWFEAPFRRLSRRVRYGGAERGDPPPQTAPAA